MTVRGSVGSRIGATRRGVLVRAGSVLDALRKRHEPAANDLGHGLVLLGTIWPGGAAHPFPGVVILDGRGVIDYIGAGGPTFAAEGLPVLGGPGSWVGPGVVDAHVHLAFGSLEGCLRAGLVGLRDLGAPPNAAKSWRTGYRRPTGEYPVVAVAGPIITAPRGYPTRSWGRDDFAACAASPAHARQVVHRVAADGADVVKIALEPGEPGWPVPGPRVVRAVVEAAHDVGLAVVAHALSVEMVRRAVDAGVDELAHTPTERLPEQLVGRIADVESAVRTTLQTFFRRTCRPVHAARGRALYWRE